MKLKNIIWIWLIFTSIACEDMLEVVPENSTTFANIETEKDIESLLRGTGQLVRTMAQWNTVSAVVRGEYADEVNTSYKDIRELNPSTPLSDQWGPFYNVIASANVAYHFVNQVDITKERREFYEGTACFYKALAYLELLHRWGDCVLMKGETTIVWEPVGKTNWPIVADYAIAMAQEAVDKLPEWNKITSSTGESPSYRSTPCKGAANALLAHLCAWKAGCKYMAQINDRNYDERLLWEKAEQACSEIINSSDYELASSPEIVCSQVLVGDSKESIYETVFKDFLEEIDEFDRGRAFTMGQLYTSWPIMPTETPTNIIDKDLRIKIESVEKMYPGNDTRKDAYFYQLEGTESVNGYAYPYKERNIYRYTEGWDAGRFQNFNSNKIWWRLADIYLLRAECRARLGGNKLQGAIDDINEIRKRANATLYNSNEYNGDLQYAIFKERERELLMEGHRFYDIMRNGPQYVHEFLEGGFKDLTEQDFIEGAMFQAIWTSSFSQDAFTRNPLMRQNTWWAKRM